MGRGYVVFLFCNSFCICGGDDIYHRRDIARKMINYLVEAVNQIVAGIEFFSCGYQQPACFKITLVLKFWSHFYTVVVCKKEVKLFNISFPYLPIFVINNDRYINETVL